MGSWQSISSRPGGDSAFHQPCQRGFGGVALAAEHRLAKEHASQQYPVQPAHQFAIQAHFDAVGVTLRVQFTIGVVHLGRDPGSRGVFAPRGAGAHHGGEVAIENHLKATISQCFRQAA